MTTDRDSFLGYFEDELGALSDQFKQFGDRYPKSVSASKIAPRSSDPHINLLIETFAYYAAKMRARVEEIKYAVPETILSNVDPALIEAIPAITLAHCAIDYDKPPSPDGITVPRGTRLFARAQDGSYCNFKTSYKMHVLPVYVHKFQVEPTFEYDFWSSQVRSVVSVDLAAVGCLFSDISADRLRLFIDGDAKHAFTLREFLMRHMSQIVMLDTASGRHESLDLDTFQSVGYDEDEAILANGLSVNSAFRLIRELAIFPQKFLFFDLMNIAFPPTARRVKILFGFNRNLPSWLSLDRLSLKTHATPVVNSYKKSAEPITLNDIQSEYVIRPDIATTKSEVICVEKVTISSPGIEGFSGIPHVFNAPKLSGKDTIFWSDRYEKSFSSDSRAKLIIHNTDPIGRNLSGHVALLDLVCHNPQQVSEITPGVGVFSNTELPGKMQIMRFPTQFYPRVQDSDTLWRTANRLNTTLPLFSVARDPAENAKSFSEYIRDYIPSGLESIRNELDAIKELTVTPAVQDVIEHGVIAIREGFEIKMIFDENAFLESNLHLFCEILNEMLSNLVAMNSFVQLKTSTLQNPEEWFLWKPGRYGKSMI